MRVSEAIVVIVLAGFIILLGATTGIALDRLLDRVEEQKQQIERLTATAINDGFYMEQFRNQISELLVRNAKLERELDIYKFAVSIYEDITGIKFRIERQGEQNEFFITPR